MSARPYPTASADADAAAAATAVAFAVTTAAGSEAAAAASHNAALLWRTKTAEAIDTVAWAAVVSVKTAAQAGPRRYCSSTLRHRIPYCHITQVRETKLTHACRCLAGDGSGRCLGWLEGWFATS
jgi:hypothetical protein